MSLAFGNGSPTITSIIPASGGPGTTVTINGDGFGPSQGNGNVWLGSTWGAVMSWSDTQIVAVVASNSINGTVKVTQNSYWSNGVLFAVPGLYSVTGVSLVPGQVSMIVGDTRTLQAQNSNGEVITGLTWISSDTTVASLSTDDPPIITALAPGHTTISAGDGSADITVYPGSALPIGTIQWSDPGDGSGVTKIVPAVPSASGVADVFAFQGDGTVQAIGSDGTVAWTASAQPGTSIPDFQGGLIVQGGPFIYKLDGMTGQSFQIYTSPLDKNNNYTDPSSLAVHPDGTVFAVGVDTVVGIDSSTGAQKFSISLEHSTDTNALPSTVLFPQIGKIIIAGDGDAYVPYTYSQSIASGSGNSSSSHSDAYLKVLQVGTDGSFQKITVKHWTGDSSSFDFPGPSVAYGYAYCDDVCMQWGESQMINGRPACNDEGSCAGVCLNYYDLNDGQRDCLTVYHAQAFICTDTNGCQATDHQSTATGVPLPEFADLITNADQGVVLSFQAAEGAKGFHVSNNCFLPCKPSVTDVETPAQTNYYMAAISTGGGAGLAQMNVPDSTTNPIQPVLQAEDGSYFGTMSTSTGTQLIHFNQSGGLLATSGNYQPAIATADGGLIAADPFSRGAVTMDANLNITGVMPSLPTQSWTGNEYQLGSIDSIAGSSPEYAASFAAMIGGDPKPKNWHRGD